MNNNKKKKKKRPISSELQSRNKTVIQRGGDDDSEMEDVADTDSSAKPGGKPRSKPTPRSMDDES